MAVPLAHIIFLLDDSSSMQMHTERTIEAFNTYVSTLKKCKGAQIKLTLIKYGDRQVEIYREKPIQDVEGLDYYPRNGCDTIFDSIAYAIKLAEEDGESKKIVICVQCDGGDTSSVLKAHEVKAMVEAKIKLGWQFNFMGAGTLLKGSWAEWDRRFQGDPDGFVKVSVCGHVSGGGTMTMLELVRAIGFPEENIIRYTAANADNTTKAFSASAMNAASFTSGRKDSIAFTAEQKKAIGG